MRSFFEELENDNPKEGKDFLTENGFLICIKKMEHHTWQGTVTWIEKQKTVSFRSALELIMIINSAVESK